MSARRIAVSIALLATGAVAQVFPPSPTASPFGAHPFSINQTTGYFYTFDHRLGDFDGDGEPDMVCRDGGTLWWQRNLGNGVFGPYIPETTFSAMGFVYHGLAADFDGDGMLDIVAHLNFGGPAQAPYLLLRRPASPSGFAQPIPLVPPSLAAQCPGPIGGGPFCRLTASAWPDVLLSRPLGTGCHVLDVVRFDRSSQTFGWVATHTFAPDITYIHLATSYEPSDLNGDGLPDLAIVKPPPFGSGLPHEIIPLLGVPPSSPGAPASFVEGPRTPAPGLWHVNRARLHDIDRDGHTDIVLGFGGVRAWLGVGTGGFLPAQYLSPQWNIPPVHGGIEIADFNRDGFDDVLALEGTLIGPGAVGAGYRVWVMLYPGTPTPGVFAAPQQFSIVEVPCVQAYQGCFNAIYNLPFGLVDFDRDGDLDTGFWALGVNGAPERYGLVRNDTVAAAGCSFAGPVPAIDVGPTLSGYSGSITLRRAPPGGSAYLFASTGTQPFPGCGGLIPDLSNLIPAGGVFHSATVTSQGTVRVPYTLPPSAAPINQAIYLQWAVTDPANPLAIRLSALRKAVLW